MSLHKDLLYNIEAAPRGKAVGAFFDFDGTLIAGFSATAFLKEHIRRGDVSPYEFLELLSALTQFSIGGLGFSGLMTSAAQLIRGVEEADYVAFGEELYQQQIARRVYPESRALVRAHQERGHTVAIISSATPYQVEPVARELGIEHLVCSRYEVKDGVFTGGIERPLCFGEGKVEAAERLAEQHGLDLGESFFYSDSDDDIELLRRVGRPQPLNPNTRLTEIAERSGWPIRRFRSRGQPGVFDFLRSVAATASLVPSAMAGLPIWALTGSQREARNFATSLFADVSSALIGLKLVVRGEQNLWARRPAVFVFNHQSKADVVIIARLLRRDIAGVGKREIRDIPVIGRTMELAGTVFIDRANAASAIEAMQPLVDAMRNQDKSVVIAPEGTRSVSPRLGPFKKGAFHLAMQAGVPMVPIVIHNAGDVAPKGDFVFRPATVEVEVLPPIDTSNWRPETVEQHVEDVRRMFRRTLGQERVLAPAPESVAAAVAGEPAPAAPPGDAADSTVPGAAESAPDRSADSEKKRRAKKPVAKKAARRKPTPKKAAPKKAAKKKAVKKKAAKKKAVRERAADRAGARAPKKTTRKKKPAKKKVARTRATAAGSKKTARRKPRKKKVGMKKLPVEAPSRQGRDEDRA